MNEDRPRLTPETRFEDLSPEERVELVRLANVAYFRSGAWGTVRWMGCPVAKCPTDLWAWQELLVAVRPDVLVETGTWAGGSALFFADLMDRIGHGRVITIDVVEAPRPEHPRITPLTGDSVADGTVEAVRALVGEAERVMVVLDSDHRTAHVAAELAAYAPLVTEGSYLVVEDTAFDGWGAWPEHGPGPAEALAGFLAVNADFEVDPMPTRHLLSLAPGGFLRRVSRLTER